MQRARFAPCLSSCYCYGMLRDQRRFAGFCQFLALFSLGADIPTPVSTLSRIICACADGHHPQNAPRMPHYRPAEVLWPAAWHHAGIRASTTCTQVCWRCLCIIVHAACNRAALVEQSNAPTGAASHRLTGVSSISGMVM